MALDPVLLLQDLIRCKSVTPHDDGALDLLESTIAPLGFMCKRLFFEQDGTYAVDNLYARFGTKSPVFAFAGHTDVVPVGDVAAWELDPFAGVIRDGVLYGRGAVDMKGAITCFLAAVDQFLEAHPDFPGSIALMITGDEEADAINGTKKMVSWLKTQGETIDACLVGEPTNPEHLGQMIKIGRRGTASFKLTVRGKQGHVAYPKQASNPITPLLEILYHLKQHCFDEGNEHFEPTNLEVTSIDVGNSASNIIPEKATAAFNIRFNTEHTGEQLLLFIRTLCRRFAGDRYELFSHISGEPFLTDPSPFTALLVQAVTEVSKQTPILSTTGGTSDARFIKAIAAVAEYGLVNKTAHHVNECIETKALYELTSTYTRMLELFFNYA